MAESKISKLANYGSDQLIRDAGSHSFFTPLGTKDDVDAGENTYSSYTPIVGVAGTGIAVPGICVVDYNIVPGQSIDGTSGLNIASKKLYTFIRHANSGSRNYDSPDLMNFAFSGVSLFTFMAECQRVYGVIQRYSCKNRYLAKSLTIALGFDYEDISSDIAGFRGMLNVAINKLNAIKIPSAWPMWNKNFMLNSVILKDGEIDRSQLYAWRSTVIWKYNETGDYVGSLTPEFVFGTLNKTLLTRASVKSIIDNIVNSFVASEDINIMSGDIVKAYGEDKCLELSLISDDYMIDPIYNREMLEIMHNTTIYEVGKTFSSTKGMIIRQNTVDNTLLFNPVVIKNQVHLEFDDNKGDPCELKINNLEYIDLMRDDVQPVDVVNSSIMTVIPDNVPDSDGDYHFNSFGTELAVDCHVYCFNKSVSTGQLELNSIDFVRRHYFTGDQGFNSDGFWNNLSRLISWSSKFDWFPRITVTIPQFWGNTSVFGGFALRLYDVYNYCVIDKSALLKLHDLHILGGFGLAE